MDEQLVSIGEAASRFGVAVSTLRYWEERGVLRPAGRRAGRRWYGADELHRIGLIQMWQETGLMSLDEIATVFAGVAAERNWREVVLERIHAIEEQIERLKAGKVHLEHLLICPKDDPAADCGHLRDVTTERMNGNAVTPELLGVRPAHTHEALT